jgi:3-oxoacyl-[acyl-carrier protein] reductase
MGVAFVFPGQGSQAPGMGSEILAAFPAARHVLEEVDDALGQRLSRLIAEGPEDELTLTENAQPALMAVSMAVLRVIEAEGGIDPAEACAFVAGHSLGEYSALVAAGTLGLVDGARLLKTRGRAMQEAVPVGAGAMAALLGADLDVAREIAEAAAEGEVCQPANDNAPGQVVLSGAKAAIDRAIEIAGGRGIRKAIALPVSAPFHCEMMRPAASGSGGGQRHRPAGRRSRHHPCAADRAGHRHGAVARIGRDYARRQRRHHRRDRRRQGAVRPGAPHRPRPEGDVGIDARRRRAADQGLVGVTMFDLSDKSALVTGASGGIGGAIARALHGAGAAVALSGRNVDALEALAGELGQRAHAIPGDLADADSAAALAAAAAEAMGSVDILVNNAGMTRDNLAMRLKDEDWQAVLDVNLTSAFRLSRAVLRGMMKSRWGRIISITSIVGVTGNPGQANYAASKAGMIGMSKSLAAEVASRGITVNCIAPGFIVTAMTDSLGEDASERLTEAIPAGRLGAPDDVAAAAVFLASEEAGYVTGQTLHVNGGMTMI